MVLCLSHAQMWGPVYCPPPSLLCHCYCVFPERAIVSIQRHMIPISSTFSLPLSAAITSTTPPAFTVCFFFSLLTANQREGETVDPAGGWVLWKGPCPRPGDKEMGVLGGQALQGLFSPHGQISNQPGNSARHLIWFQQGCKCGSDVSEHYKVAGRVYSALALVARQITLPNAEAWIVAVAELYSKHHGLE